MLNNSSILSPNTYKFSAINFRSCGKKENNTICWCCWLGVFCLSLEKHCCAFGKKIEEEEKLSKDVHRERKKKLKGFKDVWQYCGFWCHFNLSLTIHFALSFRIQTSYFSLSMCVSVAFLLSRHFHIEIRKRKNSDNHTLDCLEMVFQLISPGSMAYAFMLVEFSYYLKS